MHFGQRTNFSGIFRTLTDFGKYGVQLFFIISGFLAAKGLSKRKTDIRTYYLKRAIHILPLYFFSILWFFVSENILNPYLNQIPTDTTGLGWLRYLFFLNGFVNSDTYFWGNLGITWTIPIFVFFYLIAPFVFKYVKDYKSACSIFLLIVILTKITLHFYSCEILNNLWIFFLGIVVFYAVENRHAEEFSVLFQIITVVMIIFRETTYAYIFLFAGITVSMVMMEDKFRIPTIIQKIINYIDARTYTLYLVHGIVFCSLIDRLDCFDVPYWLRGILAVALSMIGTIIIYRFYEKPVQKWLTSITKSKKKVKS